MLLGIGGLLGLVVFVAVTLPLLLDTHACKARWKAAASAALGMEVEVGGRLGIGIIPGLHVTLKDVHIRNRGTRVASAEEANLRIDVLSLLRAKLRPRRIALKSPRISIERDLDGKFNVRQPRAPGEGFPTLDLEEFSISDGMLLYADEQSKRGFEAEHCNLTIHHLRFSEANSPYLFKNLSFMGDLACGTVRTKDFGMTALKLSIAARGSGVRIWCSTETTWTSSSPGMSPARPSTWWT
jgi:AsmA protein